MFIMLELGWELSLSYVSGQEINVPTLNPKMIALHGFTCIKKKTSLLKTLLAIQYTAVILPNDITVNYLL